MPLLNKTERRTQLAIPKFSSIYDIKQNYNEPAKILSDEGWMPSACLKCTEQYCIRYTEKEIQCKSFKDFPYEREINVCPVSAIGWDYKNEIPQFDNTRCIGCGLCANRCPIGAIYRKNNKMKVVKENHDYEILPITKENVHKQIKIIEDLKEISWNQQFQKESDEIFEEIYHQVSKFDGRSQAANILVRNLIIALGYNCAISRSGDVYTRMDAVYANEQGKGVIEIEFGRDTLAASRGILDDIAVVQSRYNLKKEENVALVVCFSFPNKRQGYFQVIKDVNNVLDLKIQTISLGALMLMVWNGINPIFDKKLYYVDFDNMCIRDTMNNRLLRNICISIGKLGILEPEK